MPGILRFWPGLSPRRNERRVAVLCRLATTIATLTQRCLPCGARRAKLALGRSELLRYDAAGIDPRYHSGK